MDFICSWLGSTFLMLVVVFGCVVLMKMIAAICWALRCERVAKREVKDNQDKRA